MLYLDSSPARVDIFCKKEEEKEKEWFILRFKGEEKKLQIVIYVGFPAEFRYA